MFIEYTLITHDTLISLIGYLVSKLLVLYT